MILRGLAALIALAGLVDPVIGVSRTIRQPLVITLLTSPSLALPDGTETRRDRAYRSASTLAAELGDVYDITVREQSPFSTANPCPADAACIVISDGPRPRVVEPPNAAGGVLVGQALAPNVAITGIDTPDETDLRALSALAVRLEARGVSGQTSSITVYDGDLAVGSASYVWPAAARRDRLEATVRMEWLPVAGGTRDLRVAVSGVPSEASTIDNEATTAVQVVERRFNVMFYEPQPSWRGTFVRRALQTDPRFRVLTRARLGPVRVESSAPRTLTAQALEDAGVAVVIVDAPQFLGRTELDELARLVRLRGASLVLLLDAPPEGRIASLLRLGGVRRQTVAPVSAGPLKASELIAFPEPHELITVLASAGDDAVVVAAPLGQGQLVAAGASDGWRFRAASPFDAFWRSVIADAARAAAGPLLVTLDRVVASVGEPVSVDVEWRSVRGTPVSLNVEGVLSCGSEVTPIELWPFGSRGRFRGAFDAPAEGSCTVTVEIPAHASAAAALRVVEAAPAVSEPGDELSAAIAAHGGRVVRAGDEAALIAGFRARATLRRTTGPLHPMRSPWWLLPFAASLGIEWWLRRRRGLA